MVSSCNNPYVAVALDRFEVVVISAEKNKGIYLGKGDCLFQRFQAGGGSGVGVKNLERMVAEWELRKKLENNTQRGPSTCFQVCSNP